MTSNVCIVCGNALQGRQTRFCSVACKNDYHQGYETQKRRGLTRKLELVKAKGGRCSICGYQKNLSALAFHHLDSAAKDFKLDMRSLSNRKLQPVQKEFGKVILVCHNCHAELHNPHLDLGSLLYIPLRFSPPLSGLWSGLSLHPLSRKGACRIVSTPSPAASCRCQGLARDYPILRRRLPRVWQVSPGNYSPGRPTQCAISR